MIPSRRRVVPFCALGCVVVLLAGCASTAAPATTNVTLPTSVTTAAASGRLLAGTPMVDCAIGAGPSTITTPALCGTLEVPEDRTDPTGRRIGIRVAVVPALARTPASDAFVALAGGPGEAGTAFFGWVPTVFADVHAARDIIVFDQRGTGDSNRLVLPPRPDIVGMSAADADARLRSWTDGWLASTDADPRQYTSSAAADDLEAIRQALGYDRLDLYGPSYGGTLAQYYLRQHPDHVRVAVMDGATPLDVPVFERMAPSSQGALDLVIARCAADEACHAAFPDLAAEWTALQAALAAGVPTDIVDPSTGQPGVATLEALGPGIHAALLDRTTAGQLPMAIHLAAAGRWAEVATAFPTSAASTQDTLAMSEIIRCSEHWARFDVAEVDRLGAGSYALPMEHTDATDRAALCRALPPGVVPADDAVPVTTDLPVLWLTADGDPQDPPANLAAVPAQEPNASIVVVPLHQHTVGHTGCAPQVIGELVASGALTGVDTTCLRHPDLAPLAFTLP